MDKKLSLLSLGLGILNLIVLVLLALFLGQLSGQVGSNLSIEAFGSRDISAYNVALPSSGEWSVVDNLLTGELLVNGSSTLANNLTVSGAFTVTGNVKLVTFAPNAVATTTDGAANVLVEDDLLNVGYHIVTPGGLASAADMTYTFPASTTLTTFLNGIGESATVCWFRVATTTDGAIIFAAGTGIDFKIASTTADSQSLPSLQITSEDELCAEMTRQPDASAGSALGLGNITVDLRFLKDAD